MASKSYLEALTIFRATPAYEEVALDLMAREAGWIAERVGINEPLSGDSTEVDLPVHGVGGSIGGPNYSFNFFNGRFRQVRWRDWARQIDPPLTDMLEFSRRPSRLDKEGALELALSWLRNLGIDLEALAAKSTPSVFHVPANSARETPAGQARPMRPQFIITWPGPPKFKFPDDRPLLATGRPMPGDLIKVEILGITKQLIELTISAPELWTRPPLELENAGALLGPDPSPTELMAKILTPQTFEIIANPDGIEGWLLTSDRDGQPKRDRFGPVKLDSVLARKFSDALLSFDSYGSWDQKGCMTDDGVRLRIQRGLEDVHVRFCFECDILTIARAGFQREMNFDPGHSQFADLVREAFPNDEVVRRLPRKARF